MTKQLPQLPKTLEAPNRKRDAIQLTNTILARLRDIAGAFWEIGQILERIQNEKLFVAIGYATFRAYVDGELSVAATQAYMMIRVVRSYTRGDAEALGLERAASLITYAKLAGGVDPGQLVRDDAPIGDKSARSASLRDIQEAARSARDAHKLRRLRSPAARLLKKEAVRIAAGLRGVHAEAALGRGVVEVRDDEVIVRFSRRVLAKRFGA